MPSILNSDDGVVSGTSGLKTTGGNDGITTFQQNGTEWMRISATGNVGIGTSSPVSGARLATVGGPVQLSGGTTSQEGIRIQRVSGYASITGINNDNNAYNPIAFFTSGTEAARIDTSGNFKLDSGYGSAATAYGCRAWVNFNGDGTVAIRASGNVSSITDNGTGDYTVNFTTAMPDANYSLSVTPGADTTNGSIGYQNSLTAPSTTACRIATRLLNTTPAPAVDRDLVMASFFR
jgi:hypothetical protein